MTDTKNDASNDVAKLTPQYTTEELANIQSFEDVMALLGDAGIQVTEITEYGDGFGVVDKSTLVNIPFVILDYKFAHGDYGPMVIVRLVTRENPPRKCIIVDGSDKSGIRPQMMDLERRGVPGGVMCPTGVSESTYDFVDTAGKKTPARSYYLNMSIPK